MTLQQTVSNPAPKRTASKLQLVKQTRTAQDCAGCPQLNKCWDLSASPNESTLVINLLVCRIKRGIHVNRSTKLLLRLLRPKLVKIAQWVQGAVQPFHVDFEELILELESVCIERIIVDYDMAGRAWPLHYLFGHPSGIRGWAMKYANNVRREAYTHYQYGASSDEPFEDVTMDLESRLTRANAIATGGRIKTLPQTCEAVDLEEELDARHERQRLGTVLEAVDDGVSLTLAEYRVMQFCLANANTFDNARSLVTGLHGFLADHAGIQRKTISKYYRSAGYKLAHAADVTHSTLSARGVHAPRVNVERRTRWLHGLIDPQNDRLAPEEIYDLIQTVDSLDGATLADICWAYGVSDRTYYKLRSRYKGKTLAEIRHAERTKS